MIAITQGAAVRLARVAAAGALALVGWIAWPAQAAQPIERVVSPGGIEAWLVSEPAIPMVAIELSFAGGAALDPPDRGGAANFLAAMLGEGAGPMDAVAFAEAGQRLAARLSFDAGRDSFEVSARMLSENLDASADLLRLTLTEPRFDDDAMARVRGQILSGIRSSETDPNDLASKAWFGAAFPDHPYGRPTEGTLDSVAAMTADDLRAAMARNLSREGLKIGVVGDIDAARLGPLLDRVLGGLPASAPAEIPPATAAKPGGVTVVDFDAPQTTLLFGHAGPERRDPDFMALSVMNHILGGGGFSSRLMTEVREKRGLAYGAYSYLTPLDGTGLVLGGAATGNARVAETIEVVRAEWRRMAEVGPTSEELDAAKRYLTGAYPLRFDSNAAIANQLVAIQRDDLGIDYPQRRNAEVEAVTVEDVRRVAAKWLRPDDLAIVAVGRPEGLPVGQ
jgi:zinc protease